jgi:hypothetical protein
MNGIDRLLTIARVYGEAEGIKPTTVSSRVFADSKKLGAIMAGGDINVGRYERAMQWFSDNWPENAVWPSDIPRPSSGERPACNQIEAQAAS